MNLLNPKINIRAKLMYIGSKLLNLPPRRLQLWPTGDASTVDFECIKGWKPYAVFSTAGALLQEGSANDYTVAEHHGIYTVTLAAAPSAADFCIDVEEAL